MEPLCLVHEEFEWMRASLDGLSFDGSTLLEIKCPLSLRDRASAQEGRIPSQYHAQLQHQLEVSGAELAHYWSFHGTVGLLIDDTPRPRIREKAGRGRGRVLAAGEGKPLARTGQRGAGSERGPKLATRRAALP